MMKLTLKVSRYIWRWLHGLQCLVPFGKYSRRLLFYLPDRRALIQPMHFCPLLFGRELIDENCLANMVFSKAEGLPKNKVIAPNTTWQGQNARLYSLERHGKAYSISYKIPT